MGPPRPLQNPPPGSRLVILAGNTVAFTLRATSVPGTAWLRTNARRAAIRRREIIESAESGLPRPGDDWEDVPMTPEPDGSWSLALPVDEPGWFEAKAWFLPEGSSTPVWPEGEGNVSLKVQPAWTAAGCSVYKAFVRMFRPPPAPVDESVVAALDAAGWSVIPPSGTFRALAAEAPHIVDRLGFRIVLLLPPFPVPTTHARMGLFGSPFAALDFYTVDPACAEHDCRTTPLEQFVELLDAFHARDARVFIDVPINHTGWAARLFQQHPEWFARRDGRFHSPGAWGVTWADLVELDYRHAPLWQEMAEVFLHWCRLGVDGFRCDAGYMIPVPVWEYITARVREEFPDTVFLLEGLGGPVAVTLDLLTTGGLDWAYSEFFQNDHRSALDWYLPQALGASATHGIHLHFAETHDNNRLAARSTSWARLRTALAAMASVNGAWGITCGVEWFAPDKIHVHGASPLRAGAVPNQVAEIAALNRLVATHPAFAHDAVPTLLAVDGGEVLALHRSVPGDAGGDVLVLANLDPDQPQSIAWAAADFTPPADARCLLTGAAPVVSADGSGRWHTQLPPGSVCCLPAAAAPPAADAATTAERRLRDRLLMAATGRNMDAWLASPAPEAVVLDLAHDRSRAVLRDPDVPLVLLADTPFTATAAGRRTRSLPASGRHAAVLLPYECRGDSLTIAMASDGAVDRIVLPLAAPTPPPDDFPSFPGERIRRDPDLHLLLTNGTGAMSHLRAAWGLIGSQYDALLAANPDPRVPVDRRIVFTRCRAWIVRRAISTALSADCCTRVVRASSSHAEWHFSVPSGEGIRVPVVLTVHLADGADAVSLHFSRPDDNGPPVQLILRPDIEDRDFHHKTVLADGDIAAMAAATAAYPSGCRQPARHGWLCLEAPGTAFTAAPEKHTARHPVDAHRGLGHDSDLFSPGWFEGPLAAGGTLTLTAALTSTPAAPVPPPLPAPVPWSPREALLQFVVRRDEGHTIIAGYPWFLDWGRDTLIALRGLITAGETDTARRILLTFARFEQQGTLPNMIRGDDCSNRDTSDAPLWFVTAVADLVRTEGTRAFLDGPAGTRSIREVLASIIDHYQSGTPNGIRMDPDSGLIFSPSHFTWMDTNHPAGTPREGYPVEIQALWHAALAFMGSLGDPDAAALAQRVTEAIARFFPVPGRSWLADCLHARPGTPAADAIADDHLRPNQLFAVTLGAVADPALRAGIVDACRSLLVPGGIRTLADRRVRHPLPVHRHGTLLNDPHAPFWPVYAGDEDTRRKPAYHNGTAWPWPMPSLAEALIVSGGEDARDAALAILEGSHPLLSVFCLGHLPEIMDGAAPHRPGGCGAQAWSISEWLRVAALLDSPPHQPGTASALMIAGPQASRFPSST